LNDFVDYKFPAVIEPEDESVEPTLGVDYIIKIEETKGINARYDYPEFVVLYSDMLTITPNKDEYAG